MTKSDYEDRTEKIDRLETDSNMHETSLGELTIKLKKMEATSLKNSQAEDEADAKTHELRDAVKLAENAAEFGERTVEKLERTMDTLGENLLCEKVRFKDISEKIDVMLNDMVAMHNIDLNVSPEALAALEKEGKGGRNGRSKLTSRMASRFGSKATSKVASRATSRATSNATSRAVSDEESDEESGEESDSE